MKTPFKLKYNKSSFPFKEEENNDVSPVKLWRSSWHAKGDGVHPGTRGLKLFNISRKRRTKTRTNIIQKIKDSDWNQRRIKKKKIRQKIREERKRVNASKNGGSNTRTIANPNASSHKHKYFK